MSEVGAGAGCGGSLQAAARLRFIVEAKKEVKAALKARKEARSRARRFYTRRDTGFET